MTNGIIVISCWLKQVPLLVQWNINLEWIYQMQLSKLHLDFAANLDICLVNMRKKDVDI